jgi:hypothetical protein
MFARVTAYHVDEDSQKLMQGFQETIGPLQQVEGFSHAYSWSMRRRAAPFR